MVGLVDANGDGTAESVVPVLTNLSDPSGIAFRGDTLYFSTETAVERLDPGAGAPVTVVAGLPAGGHSTRTFAFGPDNLLYVAAGSSGHLGLAATSRSIKAAVTRLKLYRSGG